MQLKFENHCLMPALCPPGVGRWPHWPGLTLPLWLSIVQKLDPFLADLHQVSSLLKASIKQFEKSDLPGGVQVSQEHGVGKPHYTPDSVDQGLSVRGQPGWASSSRFFFFFIRSLD